MPEVYDERGEPIGFDGPMPPEPQAPPPVMRPGMRPGMRPDGADYIHPSLAGRNAVPGNLGGMVVPRGGGGVAVGPTAQERADTQGYLAQAAKAGQLDKAQKDVEQAMRFLGMRGVEKDVQGGMAYHEALSKHLPYISYNNPAQAAAYSKIIQQAQPLSMQNLDGVRVLRTPRGDRIVPQSALPQSAVTSAQTIPFTDPTTGQPVPGYFAVPSPGGKGASIHKRTDTEAQLTPGQQRLTLNDAIKDKNAEIEAVPWVNPKDKEAHAARQLKLGTLNTELRELQAQRPSVKKAQESKSAAAPPKAERKAGQVYQTPKGPHRWTGDGWEPVQ